MSDFDITVSGSRVILDNLDALETTLQERIHAAMHEAAETGMQTMQELVPVDTGYLKSQLYAEVEDEQIRLGDDAPYAVYLELGHHTRSGSFVAPQPFIVPGAVAAGDALKEKLQGLI